MKKSWKIITSKNFNYYLYSPRRDDTLIILHPVSAFLLSKDDLHNWIKTIGNSINIMIPKYGKVSYEEIMFQYNKIKFYQQNGFLENVHYIDKHVTANQIKDNVKKIRYLTFEITELCNLDCVYCTFGKYYQNSNRGNTFLDVSYGKKVIDYIFELNNKEVLPYQLSLSFYGGEPLLNINFIEEIIRYAKELKPKQKYRFNMTTNGAFLDKHIEFLVKHNFDLLISLDGDKEHNKFRVKKDGKESYDIVYKNLKLVKENYPIFFKNKVKINSVTNTSESKYLIDYFKSEFDLKPRISQIKTFNINEKYKTEFYEVFYNNKTEDEVINEKRTAKNENNKFGYFFDSYNSIYQKKFIDEKEHIIHFPYYSMTCVPFATNLYVSAKKKLFHCEKVSDKNSLGCLDSNKLFDFDQISSTTNKFIDKIKVICKDCYNERCPMCLHAEAINENFKCNFFVSENDFFDKIKEKIHVDEDNLIINTIL